MNTSLNYDPGTPILFLTFNRPETTEKVFSQIRKMKPQRLYLASDGPRTFEETVKCERVKDIILHVDWDCDVKTLFHKQNQGCKEALSLAITWFFLNEQEGIILEDDCLPSDSFFVFCSAMLKRYRNDERIGHISGGNYQKGIKRGDGSYYFSNLTHIWGWAGWRRVWKDYDANINSYPLFENMDYLNRMPSHGKFEDLWKRNLRVHHGGANSWDYQYSYLNLINSRLAVIPNVNLISNIGCGAHSDATHYIPDHPFAALPLEEMTEIVHPTFFVADIAADHYTQMLEMNKPEVCKNIIDGHSFLRNKMVESSSIAFPLLKIPRIIHQVYEDLSGPPIHLVDISNTWKELHPHWEYKFWDKKSIDDFLESFYPEWLSFYYSFLLPVQRWDFIRYLILYHYGGLYVDMDYECLEPIDGLLINATCCWGMEPEANAITHYRDMIIGNAMIASVPGHPFLKRVIDEVICYQGKTPSKVYYVMETTGPFLITKLYLEYPDKDEITLLPAELVAPLTMEEVKKVLVGEETSLMEEKVEKAFAVHYFLGSWFSQINSNQIISLND